jgi:heat shock protein HslJ/membrane-bound inhibitor of C-type lysozyme
MKIGWLVVGATIVLVVGCARARVTAPAADVGLVGTSWVVERIEELVANRATTTVRFEEGRVSGRAGCNQYSGYLQAAGDALRVSETRTTRMACPPPVMEQETRFLAALTAVRTARREGERVLLLDETGRVRLVLLPPPPAGSAGAPRRARLYECADGPALAITELDGDAVEAWLSDGRFRLPRVPAASGVRYADGGLSVWSKGAEVRLERDGQVWQCVESQPGSPR